MARSLAAALKLAQEQRTRKPYLKVAVSDRVANVKRLSPTEELSNADAAMSHALACSHDAGTNLGVRLRVNVTDLESSLWNGSSWLVFTLRRAVSRLCAIGTKPATDDMIMATVDNLTPTQVHVAESTDGGASWGAFALAFTHTATVTGVAVAYKGNGDVALIYCDDTLNVYARRRLAGVWGAAVSAVVVSSIGVCRDVAVAYSNDWNVVYATSDRLTARIFGDGFNQAAGTWSAERNILRSDNASLTYRRPFVAQPDTWRLSFREQWTGTGAYSRVMMSHSPATADFSLALWKEPQPFARAGAGYDHVFGLALDFQIEAAGTVLRLATNSKVYRLAVAAVSLDVTADVVSCDYREGASTRRTVIALDNSDGAYNTLPAPIERGAEVRISPGYYDAGNNALSSDGPTVWIDALEHDYLAQPATLKLHCLNLWAYVDRWIAPRVIQHAAGSKNAFGILQDLFARVGFEFSASGASADSANLLPAVAIAAGERGLPAVSRILARLADVIFTRSEFAFLTEPLAAEAADWTYSRVPGSGEHELTSGRYREGLRAVNHVRVLGGATASVVGESIDYSEVERHYAAPELVADREMDTAAKAASRAAAIGRKHELAARADFVVAPVHAGVEMYDVIAVTDARVGLSAAKRRVLGLRLRYSRGRSPTYVHELELGNP